MTDTPPPAAGGTNLARLLAGMEPELDPATYVFVSVAPGEVGPDVVAVVMVAEDEGTTFVVDRDLLSGSGAPVAGSSAPMSRVTLRVHSSLEAVGLTAAVSTALSGAGISCNVVAGYHHDHLFVPTDRAQDAMGVLQALAVASAA